MAERQGFLKYLAAAFNASLQKPEVREKMLAVGFVPATGGSPEQFRAFLQEKLESYGKAKAA